MKDSINRIELGGRGIGEVSQKEIENRAMELAHSDGRNSINEKDTAQAQDEILGKSTTAYAPEESAETSGLKEWDTPQTSSGFQHPKTELREDGTIAENLVEEGIDEADHDTRVHSNDDESEKN